MPLRDHFHSPWRDEHYWEGFHSAWVNTMVRHFNGALLPSQYRAIPQVHQETYEVQIVDESRGARLVGVVELVSPGNKDRPEKVKAFTAKCAAYLQQQVGLIVVDVVTSRKINFHKKLVALLSAENREPTSASLYAVAYRTRSDDDHWRLDTWPTELRVRRKLPTLPLWLANALAVPLDLEETYQETCEVLRIT